MVREKDTQFFREEQRQYPAQEGSLLARQGELAFLHMKLGLPCTGRRFGSCARTSRAQRERDKQDIEDNYHVELMIGRLGAMCQFTGLPNQHVGDI